MRRGDIVKTVIRGDAPVALSVKPESKYEEILQNIRVLLSTAKYDVPLARELGLDSEYLHKPQPKCLGFDLLRRSS